MCEDESQRCYTITVTERQARVLSRALNVWSRALGGQLHHVGQEIRAWGVGPHPGPDATPEHRSAYGQRWERLQLLVELLLPLNALITGYHNGHAGPGIYSPDLPEEGKIAYDIDKSIRRRLWEAGGREPSWSVDGDPPLLAGPEPLARIELAPIGTQLEKPPRWLEGREGKKS